MNAPLSNTALIEKDQSHMIHPLHQNTAHANARVWVKAEGSYLIDADGNRSWVGTTIVVRTKCHVLHLFGRRIDQCLMSVAQADVP